MAKEGFAAIVGRPNVGKSTLMNTLIGQKIAITSYKPQTTRGRIRTIYSDDHGQVVFLDTPGINEAKDRLGEYMLRAAEGTLKEVDVVLWLVEPRPHLKEEDLSVLRRIAKAGTPVICCITKVDSVKKAEVLPVAAAYSEAWQKATGEPLDDIIPVSSRQRIGLEDLMSVLWAHLPEGEPFYDEETVTTQTEREIAAELIREKALRYINEEVPHGIAVQIGRMKFRRKVQATAEGAWGPETLTAASIPGAGNGTGKGSGKNGARNDAGNGGLSGKGRRRQKPANPDIDHTLVCDIDADIICEREGHKAIIIGAGGSMLKKIGTAARIDIENLVGCKVNLKLWVKVRRDWKDDANALRSYGYNEKEL